MGKQPVLAYSIAGVAVAIAIVAVSASTLGFAGPAGAEPDGAVFASAATAVGAPAGDVQAGGAGDTEYVYVDEPPRAHDDDDDDDDEHERYERRERDGLSWLRRGEHDDDDD